eukprot:TRINITY_DN14151_c0_g1_i2.p1 TRINITY_DN14151_c0_g1~~TRINITY_DN14151_c0_g1_i2.p1  ORF type:complete len:439 (+),score=63.76 TRINITY_DN14151_c0_g1_i2:87-1403(+)
MAKYWATCTEGLEFSIVNELKKLDATVVISECTLHGGVLFQSSCFPEKLMALRSADSIYAFVAHIQGLPTGKESAIDFLKVLATKIEWNHSLNTLKLWNKFQDNDFEKGTSFSGVPSVSFRVSCDRKCTTMIKHEFTSVDAEGIHCLFGWPGNMRSYDLEVMTWIRDADILLTFALLNCQNCRLGISDALVAPVENSSASQAESQIRQRPKRLESQLYAKRSYRKLLVETSLKPSTAFSLLQLADIKPGHLVVDPMCGCGTIPLEAAQFYGSQVTCLAGDIGQKAISAAEKNSEGLNEFCDVLRWDAMHLPLRSGSIDRIICDMPFGVRCGNTRLRQWLCPKVLREIIRVLVPKTGLAVLLVQGKFMRREVEMNLNQHLVILNHLNVCMEGIRAEVFVMQRASTEVQCLGLCKKIFGSKPRKQCGNGNLLGADVSSNS